MMKTTAQLMHLSVNHPNPVTRSVYREMVGNRIDRVIEALDLEQRRLRQMRKTELSGKAG